MGRILVADNSPFYRELLADALGEAGHTVRAVKDGLEALEVLTGAGPFDAAVLDLVMPRLSGARTCRQIKSTPALRATPVIILSGLREDEIDDAEDIGADAFVAKMQAGPMLEHLTAVLEEVLHGGQEGPVRRGFDDMHRREVVSELLQERRSRDVLLNSLSEGFLRLSDNGRVIEANPAALDMLHRPEPDLVNRPAAEILGCRPEVVDGLFDDRRDNRSFRLDLADRSLLVRGRGGGRDDDRFVLLTDASGAAATETARCPVAGDRERDNVLGELVSGVAHELKNPLTAILGYGELLLQFCTEDRTRQRLAKLQHEAQRCKSLVESLLSLARKRSSYRRVQSLNAVIQRAVDGLRPVAAKHGTDIRTRLASGLPRAEFDRGQMEQAIRSVLLNAVQAVESRPEGQRYVEVTSSLDGGRLTVEVHDSGPGVPVGNRDRIFDPFFTTRRHEGGAGLGLAVARGVVEEQGGCIDVMESESGARFRIDMPAAAPESLPAGAAGKNEPAVLVVDQEPVVVDLLEDVLSDAGFRVERAGNGAQALDRVTEIEFDAVLIDLKMAHLDGRRLFEAMKQRCPGLADRVVFTTSDPDGPAASRIAAETGSRVLAKPFSIEEVAATCRTVADRR